LNVSNQSTGRKKEEKKIENKDIRLAESVAIVSREGMKVDGEQRKEREKQGWNTEDQYMAPFPAPNQEDIKEKMKDLNKEVEVLKLEKEQLQLELASMRDYCKNMDENQKTFMEKFEEQNKKIQDLEQTFNSQKFEREKRKIFEEFPNVQDKSKIKELSETQK